MNKISRLAALLLAGAIVSTVAVAADKATDKGGVATVNGQSIPKGFRDALINQQKAQGAPDSPELQQRVREELIRRELLVQEAKKAGLDKKPEVLSQMDELKTQMEMAKQALLIRAFLTQYVSSHPVSDDRLKADYEAVKASLGSTEYHSRHILVEKEGDAKVIISELDKQAGKEARDKKFAELAKQSRDPGSKDNGGDLGWSAPGGYVKPFAEALTKLKPGDYTRTPVQTEFGYHVIQLDETRPLQAPPFDKVKPELQQRASQGQIEKLLQELRGKAKIN